VDEVMASSNEPVDGVNSWPLKTFVIEPGTYRFHQQPLRILRFRRRAKSSGFLVRTNPMPHGRVLVLVAQPDAVGDLAGSPSFAVSPDGWVLEEGPQPDGTTRTME
jgi:hypothetical protein